MPGPQRRLALRIFLGSTGAGAAILALWMFASIFQVLLLLFAGIVFGIFLGQLSARVSSLTSLPHSVSFGIVVILFLLIAGGTLTLMGARIAQSAEDFLAQLQQAYGDLQHRLQSTYWGSKLLAAMGRAEQSFLTSQTVWTAKAAIMNTMTGIGAAILIPFLGFYFALQPARYRHGLLKLFSPSFQPRAREILELISNTLWWWILGRLVGMVVIGVCSGIGLWALGIPLALTLGLLAGLLTFIPNIGPVLSAIPPILFGLQQGPSTALYVLIFYLALQFVESFFVTPLIEQNQVSLPPGLILSCQMIFGTLAGFLGLALATPLTVVVHILVRELYVKDFLMADKFIHKT